MKATTLAILLCGGGLVLGPAAMAANSSTDQQQGATSGPASGSTVTPNATPYKNSGGTEATGSATGAGSPGVSAKPGTEAGPAPNKTNSKS